MCFKSFDEMCTRMFGSFSPGEVWRPCFEYGAFFLLKRWRTMAHVQEDGAKERKGGGMVYFKRAICTPLDAPALKPRFRTWVI